MSEALFILQAPGFLLLLFVLIQIARIEKNKNTSPVFALVIWKIPLILIIIVCSLSLQVILSYISFNRRAKSAIFWFALSFLGLLLMGGLAQQEQTLKMQWIAQSVNSMAQIGFMFGCIILHKKFKFD